MSQFKCPRCGSDTRVLNTREKGDGIRRRRICDSCSNRLSTLEMDVEVFTKMSRAANHREVRPADKAIVRGIIKHLRELIGEDQ